MPVKRMSIPRAELIAVLIDVRCLEFVKQQWELVIENIHLWSNSKCVRNWICSDKELTVFQFYSIFLLRFLPDRIGSLMRL